MRHGIQEINLITNIPAGCAGSSKSPAQLEAYCLLSHGHLYLPGTVTARDLLLVGPLFKCHSIWPPGGGAVPRRFGHSVGSIKSGSSWEGTRKEKREEMALYRPPNTHQITDVRAKLDLPWATGRCQNAMPHLATTCHCESVFLPSGFERSPALTGFPILPLLPFCLSACGLYYRMECVHVCMHARIYVCIYLIKYRV